MNTLKFKVLGILLFFPVVLPIIYWGCEAIEVSPITRQDAAVNLIGQVKDSRTELPIEGAIVTIANETFITDVDGMYQWENAPIGEYQVNATKEGYSFKIVKAIIEEKTSRIDQIFLVPSLIKNTLDANGGQLNANFDGDNYSIDIPSGALSEPTSVEITPLIGIETPLLYEGDTLSILTTAFGDYNIVLQDSAEIKMETALPLPVGSYVPLAVFNTNTLEWETRIDGGRVNANGEVTAKIKRLGTYSVPVRLDTEPELIGEDEMVTNLNCNDNVHCVNIQNTLEIDNNDSYSDLFITNVVEQYENASVRHQLNFCQSYSCTSESQIGMSSFGVNTVYGQCIRFLPVNICRWSRRRFWQPVCFVIRRPNNTVIQMCTNIRFRINREKDIIFFRPTHCQ